MTRLAALRAIALVVGLPAPAFSQNAATPEPSLQTLVTDLANDLRSLPTSPATASVAAGGILAASFHPFDDEIAEWHPADGFKPGGWMGNPVVLAAGTLGTYGVAHWSHKPRVRRAAADLLRAQILSLGLTYSVKYTVNRQRPDLSSMDSFPSGHAAQTFASATVLARHFGAWAAVPAFGAATFVAVSRVNRGRHFLSDVVYGAGIGLAVGWNGARHASAWTVSPAVSGSGVGLRVSRRFAR